MRLYSLVYTCNIVGLRRPNEKRARDLPKLARLFPIPAAVKNIPHSEEAVPPASMNVYSSESVKRHLEKIECCFVVILGKEYIAETSQGMINRYGVLAVPREPP